MADRTSSQEVPAASGGRLCERGQRGTRSVNVDGVIHTIRGAAPEMQERGYGRIVNIASNAAIGTALPGTRVLCGN